MKSCLRRAGRLHCKTRFWPKVKMILALLSNLHDHDYSLWLILCRYDREPDFSVCHEDLMLSFIYNGPFKGFLQHKYVEDWKSAYVSSEHPTLLQNTPSLICAHFFSPFPWAVSLGVWSVLLDHGSVPGFLSWTTILSVSHRLPVWMSATAHTCQLTNLKQNSMDFKVTS